MLFGDRRTERSTFGLSIKKWCATWQVQVASNWIENDLETFSITVILKLLYYLGVQYLNCYPFILMMHSKFVRMDIYNSPFTFYELLIENIYQILKSIKVMYNTKFITCFKVKIEVLGLLIPHEIILRVCWERQIILSIDQFCQLHCKFMSFLFRWFCLYC